MKLSVLLVGLALVMSGTPAAAQEPIHLHLVWEGTGDPAALCHTGSSNIYTSGESQRTLVACLHDADENPVASAPNSLSWKIRPRGETAATYFAGDPPAYTDSEGLASALVIARGGTDEYVVSLCGTDSCGAEHGYPEAMAGWVAWDVNGYPPPPQCSDTIDNDGDGVTDYPDDPDCVDPHDDSEFHADPCLDGSCSESAVTIRYDRDDSGGTFRGQVQHERRVCRRDREVILRAVRRGPDLTIGSDISNRRGNWSLEHPGARGRFYAKAPRRTVTLRSGEPFECERDRSVTIRVGR